MAKIIDMTAKDAFKMRKFERIVEERLTHPDEDILLLWKSMAKESIRKYSGAPRPGVLDIFLPEETKKEDMDRIAQDVQNYMQSYVDNVKEMMLDMLGDMVILQKELAERRIDRDLYY